LYRYPWSNYQGNDKQDAEIGEAGTPHGRNKICEQILGRPHGSKRRLGRKMPKPEDNIKSDLLQKYGAMIWTVSHSTHGGIFLKRL